MSPTDDDRIAQAAPRLRGRGSDDLLRARNGTERCAEALAQLGEGVEVVGESCRATRR